MLTKCYKGGDGGHHVTGGHVRYVKILISKIGHYFWYIASPTRCYLDYWMWSLVDAHAYSHSFTHVGASATCTGSFPRAYR